MDVRPNKMLQCLQKHKREMAKDDEYVPARLSYLFQDGFSLSKFVYSMATDEGLTRCFTQLNLCPRFSSCSRHRSKCIPRRIHAPAASAL